MEKQQQQQEQEEKEEKEEIRKNTRQATQFLASLPKLPNPSTSARCVAYSITNDELIVCGSFKNLECYSYHIQKQQYRSIGSYPQGTELSRHTVVSFISKDNIFTILSFGGSDNYPAYHTLIMEYQSVWNNNNNNNNNNIWKNLPNNNKFGEKERYNLYGARALVDGLKQQLLFIMYPLKNITVVDLQTFQPVNNLKYTTVPISENSSVASDCFVSMKHIGKINEFIFIAKDNTILIHYDESNKEFSYEKLSIPSPCKEYFDYSGAYLNQRIFIFGGINIKTTDTIWIFNIKERNWNICDYKLPIPISNSIAVSIENHSSIHILGGWDDKTIQQDSHYIMSTLTMEEIEIIIEYWIREAQLKIGWIDEFNTIIDNYIGILL